jgi:hypothetical protein
MTFPLASGYEGTSDFEGCAYEGTALEDIRRHCEQRMTQCRRATAAVAQPLAYEERKGIERCRAANAQQKRARQPFRSLYFNIYIACRQATFLQLIRGVTEL